MFNCLSGKFRNSCRKIILGNCRGKKTIVKDGADNNEMSLIKKKHLVDDDFVSKENNKLHSKHDVEN